MTAKKRIPVSDQGPATKRDLLALGGRLDDKIDAVAKSLGNKIGGTKNDLSAVAHKLDAKIDATAKSLNDTIDATAKKLDDKIDTTAKRLDEKIGATAKMLDAKIDATANRLDAKIDATKESLAARIDAVDATTKRTAIQVANLQADVREIKTDMVTKDEFRQGLAAMTAIASRFDDEHRATLLHGQGLTEVQVGLKDHERRISGLEAKAGS